MTALLRLVLALVLGGSGAAAPAPDGASSRVAPSRDAAARDPGSPGPRSREPVSREPVPEQPASQEPESRKPVRLTLEETLERAREAAPGLAELRARRRADRARLEGAEAGRLPRIDARGGYTRQSNVPELLIERAGELQPIFPNIPDNWRLELALDLPLYTGGRIEAERRVAARQLDARDRDIEAATDGLDLAVTGAYWELVRSRDQERILAASIRAFEAHLEDARNRLDVGLAAPNEPLAVAVERDRAELRRLRAARAADVARDRLALLVELPPGTPIEPVDDVDRPGAFGDPVREPASEEEPSSQGPRQPGSLEQELPGEPLDALTALALESRPERAALERRIESARARARAISAGELPQVSAAAGFQYSRPNRRILPPEAEFEDSWDVSINVVYNLFDGGRRDSEVAAALAEVDALRRRLAGLDRDIRLEVIREYRDLETSIAAVQVARRALASARENLRVATDRHREGVIPSSERLDAEVAELRAGLDLSEALIGVRLARARLDRAIGR